MTETRRLVLLVEVTIPKGRWSSTEIESEFRASLPKRYDPTVWGCIEGVDAAYRKLRQLSRETEADRSKADRVHSAHKALSFFRDMFPVQFWRWKLIGAEHETGAKVAGR